MNDSFVFYKSFVDAIDTLGQEDQLMAYQVIAHYATSGEEPDPSIGIAYAIFLMAKPQLDANSSRRNNGLKGGRPKKETDGYEDEKPMVIESENHRLSDEKPNVNVNANVNVNEDKKESKEKKRFVPPTVAEVQEYCTERGNRIDAQQFVDFYASKGWKVGREPMKDWKACVRTWEKRETARSGTTSKSSFNSIMKQDYDFNAIEEAILK